MGEIADRVRAADRLKDDELEAEPLARIAPQVARVVPPLGERIVRPGIGR